MSLDQATADWLYRFTAGEIDIVPPRGPNDKEPSAADLLMKEYLKARSKEEVIERQTKEALLKSALATIERKKDIIREYNDFIVSRKTEDGKQVDEKMLAPEHKAFEIDDMRSGRKTEFKTGKGGKLSPKEQGKQIENARRAFEIITNEALTLAAAPCIRSTLPEGATAIVLKPGKLFTDAEIAREIYTPLLREKLLAPTFVPDKWSETQDMLDGSDKYYIKECREKGKLPPSGALALTKATINVASQIATTVVGGLATPKTGQDNISGGVDLSKNTVAQMGEVNAGITTILTVMTDIGDKVLEQKRARDFSPSAFFPSFQSLGGAIGKVVGGALGDDDVGGLVTIALTNSAGIADVAIKVGKWVKEGGADTAPFPTDDVLNALGGIFTDAFNIEADITADDVSVKWSNIATEAGAAFRTALSAKKALLALAAGNGNSNDFVDLLMTAAGEASKAVPGILLNNVLFNTGSNYTSNSALSGITSNTLSGGLSNEPLVNNGGRVTLTDNQNKATTGYNNEQSAGTSQTTIEQSVDKSMASLKKIFGEGGKKIQFKDAKKREATAEKLAEVKKKVEEAEKEKAKETEAELKGMMEALEKEKKEYLDSLNCLGETDKKESDYKSIAKLIEQIERDRKFVDGLIGIFGGGIGAASGIVSSVAGVASQVVPALKAAGQLAKLMVNAKAAYDRGVAWKSWSESNKDAISANSAYYTTIKNFQANMRNQTLQYSLQALANTIQLGLSLGGMSPLAPAMSVASGAVGAAAATADAVYKFIQQRTLVKAWHTTKQAIDPANKGNRKMRLLARRINPTLAKYTIAYGALIRKDPIAITAMDRCHLDRETLARAGNKVGDVKKYLEKLYPDDGTVLVTLDVEDSNIKVPDPELASRTWALTYALWVKEAALATPNSGIIIGHLATYEELQGRLAKLPPVDDDADPPDPAADKRVELNAEVLISLKALKEGFSKFEPKNDKDEPVKSALKVVAAYQELAEVEIEVIEAEAPGDRALIN